MNILSRTGDQIITLAEAKANSRVTYSAEDDLFQIWIDLASSKVEIETGLVFQQAICAQDVYGVEYVDLVAPVRGIVSVLDADGEEVDYTYYKTSGYGCRIELTTEREQVTIKYIAGFDEYTASTGETAINEGDIDPYPVAKSAVLFLTNHYYENRGVVTDFEKHELPIGFNNLVSLIKKYR